MESKKEKSFLSISSEEEDFVEEENINKTKNKNNDHIGNKKDNNILDNIYKETKFNIKEKEKENSDKEYILKLRNKLANNTIKTKNKKMLILPPPENELTDKHLKENISEDEDNENKGYIKLMNPDNINLDIKESDLNDNINKDKNIISINQKDILDQNWEIKYINKILKKDMKEAIKNEENIDNKNKINKKRKRDKNKNKDELNDENIRSKYDKITTKKRYGW